MKLALSLAFAASVLLAGAATAAVVAPPAPHTQSTNLIQISGGCGRNWHRTPGGHCVPDREDDYYWHRRHHDRDDWDGCGRYHHRNRHGRCVPNY